MARKLKYDWGVIQKAYEDGITVNEISKKYGVTKKTLQNKISSEKWEIMGTLNSQVDEFRESLGKITGSVENDPVKQEIIVERLNTIIEDNEIIGNNRKLAKAFQGLVGQGIRGGIYKTPQDIKAGTSTLKDLENISNPQSVKNEVNVNTQNNLQVNKIVREFIE